MARRGKRKIGERKDSMAQVKRYKKYECRDTKKYNWQRISRKLAIARKCLVKKYELNA